MPKTIVDLTVQAGETRTFTSTEGVEFQVTNRSIGFKKVRLAFVYSKGRKKKGSTVAAALPESNKTKETNASGKV